MSYITLLPFVIDIYVVEPIAILVVILPYIRRYSFADNICDNNSALGNVYNVKYVLLVKDVVPLDILYVLVDTDTVSADGTDGYI